MAYAYFTCQKQTRYGAALNDGFCYSVKVSHSLGDVMSILNVRSSLSLLLNFILLVSIAVPGDGGHESVPLITPQTL